MAAVDLSTTYLGLRLANPFMTGASPLADHLDTARRLEDAGCAAIVLHSLFEEQITQRGVRSDSPSRSARSPVCDHRVVFP